MTVARKSRRRRNRHSELDGLDRGTPGVPRLKKMQGWINRLVATLSGTGAANAVTAVPASNTLTRTAHGYQSGDGPFLVGGTAVPAGLSASTPYFVRAVDANTLALYLTRRQAKTDTNRQEFTTAGTAVTLTAASDEAAIVEHLKDPRVTPDELNTAADIDNVV